MQTPRESREGVHKHLRHLNARQREVALHRDGPMLVLAGAGSGKTTTMASRISTLIGLYHVPPYQILGLSFTRKAAQELKTRVLKSVKTHFGETNPKGLMLSTFHALGVWILRNHGQDGKAMHFSIIDEGDQKGILTEIARGIRFDDRKFDLDIIRFEISRAKNSGVSISEFSDVGLASKRLNPAYWEMGGLLFERYQERLKSMCAFDFDDLIQEPVRLLQSNEALRRKLSQKFRYVLVDEYQDTNPTQFNLLKQILSEHSNIVVVGDDDQAIYGWRGAQSDFILNFPKMFEDVKIVTLDQNYRSTQKILEAANAVIAKNTKRHSKTLWSNKEGNEPITELICTHERDEAELVAKEIFSRTVAESPQRKNYKDFAILYRSNTQARLFEEALRRHQIPYKIVGGMSFLDRKEVKDILSLFKIILNPLDDSACRRALAWPARGLGEKTLDGIRANALDRNIDFISSLKEWASKQKLEKITKALDFIKAYDEAIAQLTKINEEINQLSTPPEEIAPKLVTWGKAYLESTGYLPALYASADEPKDLSFYQDITEELLDALGQKSDAIDDKASAEDRIHDFISRLSVSPENEEKGEKDKHKDQVTLLTLHGAKGLEYNTVFLVGCEEGYMPHQRTIDEGVDFSEERRLAYVGITRAQEILFLTRATHRTKYGKKVPRTPSRFLTDIPKDLIVVQNESMDETAWAAKRDEEHEQKVISFFANLRNQLENN